jgi:cytochrome c oxidase accessory protein FixG
MWIERQVEGDRSARMRLDESDMSMKKFSRKFIKHALWIALSLWTGFTFVGYFTPIHSLWTEVVQMNTSGWETFWLLFYGFATYGNAGFMREQVCKYMCPYARFQSAMFDHDTLIVTYDTARGEPRGARSRKADRSQLNLGECVDCSLCVQVCPTGIDIRKGLQYECIGCGACADVCDTVMDKMGYPRGLVRFTTQNALDNGWTRQEIWRRVLRPRVLIYTSFLVALVIGLMVALSMRIPFKVDVVRDRATLARINDDGQIENIYRLQIMNASENNKTFRLSVKGLDGIALATDTQIDVEAVQSRWIVSRVTLPYDAAEGGSHPVQFVIEEVGGKDQLVEKTVFLVPR